MEKRIFILTATAALANCFGTYAQSHKWTLQECIGYAIAHNIEVRQSRNQVNSLNVQKNTLKNSFLPELTAGASQKFDFGRALNQSNTYEDSNIQSSAFSVSAEVTLFEGFRKTASIAQNKFDLLAAEANRTLIENNLSLNVTGAFFQILLDKEILRIAQEQIGLTQEQEVRTRLLIENGKAAPSQLYEVKAQLADDELAATEAQNALRLSTLELMQLMELKGNEPFDIDSTRTGQTAGELPPPARVWQTAVECMPQIRQAYYSLQGKLKSVKVARASYYPTLSAGAGISTGYYYYGKGLSEAFRSQFVNNMQKSIYFTLSIPLFDRLATRNQVRSARIEADNARLALDNEKKGLYKEIEKAYTDAVAALEKYKSTEKAVLANQEAHRYAQEKYAAGKSTVFEYNEIKMKLADALSKQSQAKYTYLLKSKILDFYACHPLD